MNKHNKKTPESVQMALNILRDMPVDIRDNLQKILPGLALALEKSGETVTEELLNNHIVQGAEHLKYLSNNLKKVPFVKKTPLEHYQQIVETFPEIIYGLHDNPILVDTNTLFDQFTDAAKAGDLPTLRKMQKEHPHIQTINHRALQYAAEAEQLSVMEYFIKQDENLHADNNLILCKAAENGLLSVVKFCALHGADIHAHDNTALRKAAENGHLDIVKYCLEKGGDIQAVKYNHSDSPFNNAVHKGHLPIVKYCVEKHNVNVAEMGVHTLLFAIRDGHFDIVKYLVEECGADVCAEEFHHITKNRETPLNHAILQGHLDIVKYLIEERNVDILEMDAYAFTTAIQRGYSDIVDYLCQNGANIHIKSSSLGEEPVCLAADKGLIDIFKSLHRAGADIQIHHNASLVSAIRMGHLDIVKYCVEQDDNFCPDDQNLLRWATGGGHTHVVRYLVEQGADLSKLDNGEEYTTIFKKMDQWKDMHGKYPPVGLEALSPYAYKPSAFRDIVKMLKEEGYKGSTAHQYAYQATALFGTTPRILNYLKKWGKGDIQPLHNIIQHIRLPKKGRANLKAWGDAVLKHGPKMARLVKFAGKMPEPLKNTDGTWSYKKTREEVAKYAYKKGKKYPALAAMCLEYAWDNDDFKNAIRHITKYQEKYTANDNQKPDMRIPDIEINGTAFNKEGYRFYKLQDGDIRGLFLGEMTDCCQHLASAGKKCTSHGFLSEHSGFYVVEKEDTKQIVAQTWAWRGTNNELVLDSLESLSGHFNETQWKKLCEHLGDYLENNKTDVTSLHVGRGGATPSLSFNAAAATAEPKKYRGYRDSDQQYRVWKKITYK